MPNADFETKLIIEKEIRHFQKLHSGIKVQCEVIPWLNAWPRIIQAFKEKSDLDILMLGTTWVKTLAYLGVISEISKTSVDINNFIPAYVDVCRYDNHLWAVPWFCEAKILFCRKDHLEAAGIRRADLDTWDGFYQACLELSAAKVSKRKVPPLGFSIQGEQVLTQNIASWIWSYGGDFVSSDGKHSLLKDPKTKVGLKTFLKIIGSKLVSDPALLQLSTGDVITEFFLKDAYSFVIASPWPLRIFLNPEVPSYVGEKNAKNYGITFVPKGPAGRFCFGGGSALAITSFTKHPQEADLLLKFLSTADSQKRYCRHIGMYPGRKDVDITLPFLGDGQEDFKNAVVKFGRSFPSHPLWGSVERIISSGLSDALVSYSRTYNQKIFLKNIDKLSEEVEQIFNLFGE